MCRILLVEDHGETRRALALLLERWGHRVSSADSVGSALAFFRAKEFDAIVSDIQLPDGTGHAFISEVRRSNRSIFAVAVTSLAGMADREESRSVGFNEHFAKPVDLANLQGLLTTVATRTP